MAIVAYVLFKVASGTEPEVAEKLVEFKEVLDASIVFGEYDVIARVELDDVEKLQSFVSNKIRSVPDILVTSTMIISKEYTGKGSKPKGK